MSVAHVFLKNTCMLIDADFLWLRLLVGKWVNQFPLGRTKQDKLELKYNDVF